MCLLDRVPLHLLTIENVRSHIVVTVNPSRYLLDARHRTMGPLTLSSGIDIGCALAV